jgi:hypothetical protein
MACSLYLLFNHQLTAIQQADAHTSLGVQRIFDLPPDLQEFWRQIPPDLPELKDYLGPIKTWLSDSAVEASLLRRSGYEGRKGTIAKSAQASKSDYVLIQGDFGACYIMVNFAFEIGLIPIYSTTLREAVEEHKDDGSVKLVHQFNHQIFRKYGE